LSFIRTAALTCTTCPGALVHLLFGLQCPAPHGLILAHASQIGEGAWVVVQRADALGGMRGVGLRVAEQFRSSICTEWSLAGGDADNATPRRVGTLSDRVEQVPNDREPEMRIVSQTGRRMREERFSDVHK
jgi:hypothetical protein